MERSRFARIIPWIVGGIALAIAAAFIFGFFVMVLWNWLMPVIFGLGIITYWQAWGLVLLSHLLFKVSGHHSDHDHHGEYWKTKFQHKFRERCKEQEKGIHVGNPSAEANG
ncbi:MAG: hypothetical protein JXR87_05390 [Candidatus Marinimicrobia bacterium]|nr:hypothetical protein [Candidatus Neomarinimicrobiota bacterium]